MVWTVKMVHDRIKEEGDCWIWQLGVSSRGYPQARIDRKASLVGAWLYHHLNSTAPDRRHVVKTKCGNRLFVSPKCLVRVSRSESVAAASRNAVKVTLALRARAIREGWAKLDMEKARAIRASNESAAALAEVYGVSRDAIYKIRRGTNWAESAANSSVFNWRPAA